MPALIETIIDFHESLTKCSLSNELQAQAVMTLNYSCIYQTNIVLGATSP